MGKIRINKCSWNENEVKLTKSKIHLKYLCQTICSCKYVRRLSGNMLYVFTYRIEMELKSIWKNCPLALIEIIH